MPGINFPKNLFFGIVFYAVSAYNELVRRFTVCGMETLFIQTRFTMYGSETLFIQTRFTMCGSETLFNSLRCDSEAFFHKYLRIGGTAMIERGLYYATASFAQMIKNNGGTWNDTKHRPIVCLIKSKEHEGLYWAIPMGKLNHCVTAPGRSIWIST